MLAFGVHDRVLDRVHHSRLPKVTPRLKGSPRQVGVLDSGQNSMFAYVLQCSTVQYS